MSNTLCTEVIDNMADVLDGSADQRLLDHIADCDTCRDARHDAERARLLVEKAGADFVAPADLEARLAAALEKRKPAAAPTAAPTAAPPAPARRPPRGNANARWRRMESPPIGRDGQTATAGAARSPGCRARAAAPAASPAATRAADPARRSSGAEIAPGRAAPTS
jgi:hypothetical protein